jgi:glycerophosphoryl diester phosphodiesterase
VSTKRTSIIILFLVSFLAGCSPRTLSPTLLELRTSEKILHWSSAHRGDQTFAHGNSLPAILHAAQVGIPLIETDLRKSSDNVIILFHGKKIKDENVETFSQGLDNLPIASLSAEVIQRFEYRASGKIPASPIITFETALRKIKPYSSILQLDIKSEKLEDYIDAVELAKKHSLENQIIVQSSDREIIRDLRMNYPSLGILARVFSAKDVERFLLLQPDIVQIDEEWMNEGIIEKIHAQKAKVLVKILGELGDTVEHREKLFESGVDIVLTDFIGPLVSSPANYK